MTVRQAGRRGQHRHFNSGSNRAPDLLGLGENIPISTANFDDGFAALKDGQMIMLRIPYPLSFFAKGSSAHSPSKRL
jgi:hypothetical protein